MNWYLRDASWWSRPNVTSSKRFHARKGDTVFAVCNSQVVLDLETPWRDLEASDSMRCKRCKKIIEVKIESTGQLLDLLKGLGYA